MRVNHPLDLQLPERREELPRAPVGDPQQDFSQWTRDAVSPVSTPSVVEEAILPAVALTTLTHEHLSEAVLYPWSLRAGYGWSHSHGSNGEQNTAPAAPAISPDAANPLTGEGAAALPPAMATVAATADQSSARTMWAFVNPSRVTSIRSGGEAGDLIPLAPLLAEPWPMRMLRRTLDAGGAETWWLRDFRLTASEIEQIAVRWSSQRDDGGSPARLMINGVQMRHSLFHALKEQDSWR